MHCIVSVSEGAYFVPVCRLQALQHTKSSSQLEVWGSWKASSTRLLPLSLSNSVGSPSKSTPCKSSWYQFLPLWGYLFSARKKNEKDLNERRWTVKIKKKRKTRTVRPNRICFFPILLQSLLQGSDSLQCPDTKSASTDLKSLGFGVEDAKTFKVPKRSGQSGTHWINSLRVFSHTFCFFLNRSPNILWQWAGGSRVGSAPWDPRGTGTSAGCSRSRGPCGHC